MLPEKTQDQVVAATAILNTEPRHMHADLAIHVAFTTPAPPRASGSQTHAAPHAHYRSLALVMTITSLALVGTAGTFGYREVFGGSVLPIPPPIICSGLQDAGGDCVILKN